MLPNRLRRSAARDPRGMTLLELVLSLALSALLLMAISMALHIHWRAFDIKRSRVEEAQLASAILRNISDDIRSTLKFEPPNLEGLDLTSLVANAAGGAIGEGTTNSDSGDGGGDPNNPPEQQPNDTPPDNESDDPPPGENPPNNDNEGTPSDDTGAGGTGTSETAGGTATEGEMTAESGPSTVVGLYGSATQLQFDVSRLPRVDQYQSQETEDGSLQIPSDIKTVVYFLAEEEVADSGGAFAMTASAQPSTSGTGRGLMRAESDRAVSAFGEINGSTDSLFAGAKQLAAEVTSLQFQYFDGTEWLTEWNSDDLGGLPTAIEVVLTIGSPQSNSDIQAATPLGQPLDETTQPTYRMVVHLPVGGISPAAAESTEMTESTDAAGGNVDTGTPTTETTP
ncbi:MAG TPA: prepilin-type N-terminal cleavage/methylation domain-containing protein [Pirellulaceae bacterium]|nr:prepilin-type N-terminal cleavage/methylation domain-containing protein [Pirellulaceae bacterium]